MPDVASRLLSGCPDLLPVAQGLPARMPVVWLDSARLHPVTGRWSLLGFDPWLTLTAQDDRIELRTSASTRVWREPPPAALRTVLRRYRVPARREPHMNALGLMGFFSYEFNGWMEPRLRSGPARPSDRSMPEMAWFGMRVVILVDHADRRSWLLSVVDPHLPPRLARREAADALDEAEDRLRATTSGPGTGGWRAPSLQATSTPAEFTAMVSRALDEIRAGEIFQANVSQRFTSAWQGSSLALYQALRRANPSPFACFLSWDDLSVVSCSPERLVRVQDGWADTRPIAGTRPRGASPEDDALKSLELLLSDKERAEHIMLVDLARNDLGRVCAKGSVRVNELMDLEAYSHVMHIVSDVCGRLRSGVDALDVIRAVFPGGTITGCPKVRCMQILRELEPVPRGLYTGSIGRLGFDGAMDLNIAIRTIVIQGDRLSFHVGAGIVADSDPEREYQETLAKAGALVDALKPVEPHGPVRGTPNTTPHVGRSPPQAGPRQRRWHPVHPHAWVSARGTRHSSLAGPDGGAGRDGPHPHAAAR